MVGLMVGVFEGLGWDILTTTTPNRPGCSTQNMLVLAETLRGRGPAGLRVLNLGRGDMDTATPMGSMMFTIIATSAQMELEIKRERIIDSVVRRRAAGMGLGGLKQTFTDSPVRSAVRLIDAGETATQVARDLGISRATLHGRIRELPNAQWFDIRIDD
jgi:DNA invertase Pin-like site-specific DNA recombinase